jgi:hypothetical protein
MFDQLQIGGLFDLGLGGTVVLNFIDDLLLDTFSQSLSIFNLFLGVDQEASLFSGLAFEGMSSTRMASILLADNGSFTISDIGTMPPPTSVPEPGTLWLMVFALLALIMVRRRGPMVVRLSRSR